MDDLNRLITQAESILSSNLSSPVKLKNAVVLTEEDRRNKLIRVHLEKGPANAPSSFIIKQASPSANLDASAELWFFNDWAGIEFLTNLPQAETHKYGPKFYGGHREERFIIMEDLGTHNKPLQFDDEEIPYDASLVQPLLQETALDAQSGLIELGKSLGRLHSATANREKAYNQILQSLGVNDTGLRKEQVQKIRDIKNGVPKLLNELDIDPLPNFYEEIERVADSIENPGPFLVYTHGDPCPDNCTYVDGQFRLLDFEFGGFRHALLDAVYGRISFPTCWCCNQVPMPVVNFMESVYRNELIKGCPEAANDELFGKGLTEACAFWTLMTLRRIEEYLEKDEEWGIATIRQRVLARLSLMINTANEFNHLLVFAKTLSELEKKLERLWPDVQKLPIYPAFNS